MVPPCVPPLPARAPTTTPLVLFGGIAAAVESPGSVALLHLGSVGPGEAASLTNDEPVLHRRVCPRSSELGGARLQYSVAHTATPAARWKGVLPLVNAEAGLVLAQG